MIDLIYNLTLLVALSVVSGFISQRWSRDSVRGDLLQGLLFGSAAVLAMSRPLVFAPGLIFDGRSVMISLCGLFFGLRAVGLTACLTIAYRIWQGGVGTTVGILVIVSSSVIGLLYARLRRTSLAATSSLDLYLFGVVVHLAMLAIMLLLPEGLGWRVLQNVGLPILLTYPLATVLIGKILSDQERNRQMLQDLQTSEARYRLIADNTTDVLWVWNIDTGAWDFLSPSVERLRGFTVEEVRKQSMREVLTPASFEHVQRLFAERAADFDCPPEATRSYVDEVEQICKDGSTVWTEVNTRYAYNDRRERIIIGVSRDIQERKRTEAVMKESREALRRSEERIKALLQAIPDLMFVFDRQGVFRDFHTTDPSRLMIAPEQFLHRSCADVLPPELANLTLRHLKMLFEGASELKYEYSLDLPSGKRFFESRMYPCGNDLVLAIVRDITDFKASEEEKLQLQQQVHQSQTLESLGVLAGGIAHDFNNILMGILGNAELAEADLSPDSPALERLRKIVDATNRAADLCRQMLTYSGSCSLACENVILPLLVQEIIRLLKTRIPAKTSLRLDFPTQLPSLFADPYQIRQMLRNLITNASEAITHDHGLIIVSANCRRYSCDELAATEFAPALPAGEYISICVEDNGTGMDEDVRRRMFEPFFSTKFVGRGLGLPSVLGIVRAHGGAVAVETTPGRGTSMKVLLPVTQQQRPQPKTPVSNSPQKQRNTVLFADDEESLREITQATLSRLGFRVLQASNGREAIELYKSHQSEIVVSMLDLSMPEFDGIQTLQELRKIDPHALIVITSGYSEEDIRDRFHHGVPSAVLQKPFSLSRLKEVFAKILPKSA